MGNKTKQRKITDFMPDRPPPNIPKTISTTIDTTEIKCFQLNNQKRIISCEKLNQYCEEAKSFLCLGQEPSTYGTKVTGLNSYHTTVYADVERPRAYIYAHRSLKIWPMNNLCSQDTAVALLDTGMDDVDKIMFCSIYWDGRITDFPTLALDAMKLAHDQGHTFILGGDANARSCVYGSSSTDTRGRTLEQIMLQNNLSFLNIGTVPTCTAGIQGSVIDVTAITGCMEDLVSDWKVSNLESYSDHKIISFSIKAIKPEEKLRNYMTDDQKSKFSRDLDIKMKEIRTRYSMTSTNVHITEQLADEITEAYNATKSKNSTTVRIKPPKRSTIWKDPRVKEQNIKKNEAKYLYRHAPNSQNKKILNKEHKLLQQALRKARKSKFTNFTEQVLTPKDMAKLVKFAKTGKQKEIGLIKDENGVIANSPIEALDNLCRAHFPDAVHTDDDKLREYVDKAHENIGTKPIASPNWLRDEVIKKAIMTFKNNKAPGLDGITPEMLKLTGAASIETLRLLFNMQITLGYTPNTLRTSKVTFIGKPEKEDYTKAKSYRPISLTPFIFKLLERAASWYIIHKTLDENPLNRRQHAYRAGKSTESAISQVINQVEKGLLNRSYTLACFIDISSAFDKLNPTKAAEALLKKGVPKSIVLWYKNYLTHRILTVEIKGTKVRKSTSVGCPQGGVLSTILWNIAFDNLLNLFNNDRVICVGYADDGSLLLSHNNLPYLYMRLNESLKKCQKWAEDFGLDISPEKTKYMLFTNKTKYRIPTSGLTLKGTQIERVTNIKYLGVTLNEKLKWDTHLKTKLSTANKLLFKLKGFIGKTWGPSPKMTLYAYTACIRPLLTYGCFAIDGKISSHMKQKLRSFQRRVLMLLGNFRDNTPGDALEVIFDIPPLNLFISGEAIKTNYRLRADFDHDWSGMGKNNRMGHVLRAKQNETQLGIPAMDSDTINNTPTWEKEYFILGSDGSDSYEGLRCYTDGSKTRHGVGAGICIMNEDRIVRTRSLGLPTYGTVYQAELYAIKQACGLIKSTLTKKPELRGKHNVIRILSDSQAALQALSNIDTTSQLVKETKLELNKLGKEITIDMAWIKAHVNHKGNEMADQIAKTGTKLNPTEEIRPSKCYIKSIANKHMYEEWNNTWTQTKGHRQSKLFMPNVYQRGRANKTRNLSREDLSVLVRYITGHAFLRRHNHIIAMKTLRSNLNLSDDVEYESNTTQDESQKETHHYLDEMDITNEKQGLVCRKCRLPYTEETPHHIIVKCDAIWRQRWAHLKTPIIDDEIYENWEPEQLALFLKTMNLEGSLSREDDTI